MTETTIRTSLMALADLFDTPQRFDGPDAQRCQAGDHPEAWTELTVGWSRILDAAKTIRDRHTADSRDDVLAMCADASREAAIGELRWCWARLVNGYVEAVESDA
ncbi:hypothetical protein [Mycobacteroides abscessus]|uniref:hypothetical protein n=1 Tax=Mycobacteroides abscessus TaxID=36809 RepID=UPI001F467330|nr:hypothetical protein [Mycobacteroides abscessus]